MATKTIYNSALKNLMNGTIDLDTATIRCMLVTASYTPDRDAHEFKSSVTNEITGAGYTAGGVALTGKVVSQDNALDRGKWTSDYVEWTSATFTAYRAIFYVDTGNPATSPLIMCYSFDADKSVENGTFRLTPDSAGILYMAQS